jgi:hypothetical protein
MAQQKLFYSPPNGPSVDDAKLENILDRILNGAATYWCAGSYHATIYLGKHGGGAPSVTLLFVKEFDAFYLEVHFVEVVDPQEDIRDFVTRIPDARLGRTEIANPWAGQNPYRLPRDFCVSRQKCAEIVTIFCLRGELDPNTHWVTHTEAGWDFNPDDE